MVVDRSKTVDFSKQAKELRFEIHSVLKQANYDYERMQYNTVVSAVMKMLNTLEDMAPTLVADASAQPSNSAEDSAALAECLSILIRVLYPVCPHIAFALWTDLGYAKCCGDLLDVAWAEVDESALVKSEIELVLQINGKLRGAIQVSATATKAEIEQAAVASDTFVKVSNGAVPKKVVVVPGRLVNIVV